MQSVRGAVSGGDITLKDYIQGENVLRADRVHYDGGFCVCFKYTQEWNEMKAG